MDLTKISVDRRITTTFNTVIVAIAFAIAAIGVVYFKADISGLFLFLLFFVFYMQLPGMMILVWLRAGSKHLSTNIATGFFLGWALVTAEYFVTTLVIHTNVLLYVLGPLLSLIYIYKFIRNKGADDEYKRVSFSGVSMLFMIFALLGFLYAMLFSQFEYMAPGACAYASFPYPDNPFHMGIINGLADGFLPRLPWIESKYYQYHFFSELLMSVPVKMFGMKADFLVISCTPYLVTFAFSTALYSFYREFTSKKSNAGLYCMITLLANLYMKSEIRSGLWLHVFGNVNNAGYGVAAAMVTLVALKRAVSGELKGKDRVLSVITLMVLMMLTTGIKGPMGAVLIAAVWGTFILALILRKIRAYQFMALLIATLGFAAVYILVIGMKGQNGAGGGDLFVIGTITDGAFYKDVLISALKDFGIPEVLRKGVLAAAFTLFGVTAFFVPYIIGYIRELVLVIGGRKEYDFARVTVYAASLVGLMAMFLLNYNGHSQAYFGFLGMSLAPIIAIWFLEDVGGKGIGAKLLNVVFVIMFAAAALLFAVSLVQQVSFTANYNYDSLDDRNRYLTTSQAEYEAMMWIEENTPEDSLMATNRYESKSPDIYSASDRFANTYFAYSIYAHRYFWFEGAGYSTTDEDRVKLIQINDRIFDAEDTGRDELVKEIGIDYVIASKRFKEVEDLEDNTFNRCYENEDVIIYEIR